MVHSATGILGADKSQLLNQFKGKGLDELPTPCVVIDRKKFTDNSEKMLKNAEKLNAEFRAHIKTHKTVEGTEIQLGSGNYRTDKVLVSTFAEAWGILDLVSGGKIQDVLYSLPVFESRLPELIELSSKIPNLRLMVDNVEQLLLLNKAKKEFNFEKKWSVFVKINMGTNRAGLVVGSDEFNEFLANLLKNEESLKNIDLYGFYCHAGHSYASKSTDAAKDFLIEEITHANKAALIAKSMNPDLKLVISVGATPTAVSSGFLSIDELNARVDNLAGKVELHAGNYPCFDLQQISTKCINPDAVSLKLLADIVSLYPKRGNKLPGEQLINAGVVALGREPGPFPGFGRITNKGYENWIVGRVSQEHGILTPLEESENTEFIPIGTRVAIIPQHACITAASHPYFFVIENQKVSDIWVPARGW